jgi:hypothetical protein
MDTTTKNSQNICKSASLKTYNYWYTFIQLHYVLQVFEKGQSLFPALLKHSFHIHLDTYQITKNQKCTYTVLNWHKMNSKGKSTQTPVYKVGIYDLTLVGHYRK